MRRHTNTQTVGWFLELADRGQLDLDPPYQRRSVWNLDYRRFFIDSVLRNYPCPPIFLNIDTKPGRPTIYHVIDGKQRLATLISFSTDGFDTGGYLDDLNARESYYSDLQEDVARGFLDYVIPVENVQEATSAELQSAFDRLNRNVARLNGQELRNARFSGVFITLMTRIADEEFWEIIGVSSLARVRRMLDVEYVSELFLLTMHGVQDGKTSLDDFYSDYDDEIPDERTHLSHFRRALDYLRSLPIDWRRTRLANLADFYSLWAAVVSLQETNRIPGKKTTAERLENFEDEVNRLDTDRGQQYLIAARQGSNKESNRLLRRDILEEVILSG